MKTAVLALTPQGLDTARRICRLFARPFLFIHPRLMGKRLIEPAGKKAASGNHAAVGSSARIACFSPDLRTFTAAIFPCFDTIIFVMAAGIAVRMVGPCLRHKKTDPAVIVLDDTGCFAVSLLGGHQRGANDLTEQIAAAIGAAAVITTATDRRRITAFDLLARRRNWELEHAADLKKISAAQLEGREICLYADAPFLQGRDPELPAGCRLVTDPAELSAACSGAVLLSNRCVLPELPAGVPFVILRPRNLVAGIGCRRGVPWCAVIGAVEDALAVAGRVSEGLMALATIDLKSEERGLLEAARFFKVPLRIFSREAVGEIEHRFAHSPFVRRHTGVGAVAEPCACLGSGGGSLILGKKSGAGITVALAESPLPPLC